MMKISIMKDFIHSPFHRENVKSVLEKWGYDEDTVKFIRASSNFVYSFKREDVPLILRLTPNADLHLLEREVAFLEVLAEGGMNVNSPVISLNGNKIERISLDTGIFHVVVFTYCSGRQLDLEDLTDNKIILWGKEMGRLHLISSMSGYEAGSKIETLPLPLSFNEERDYLMNWLEKLDKTPETYGAIHYDFELDNIIWNGNTPQIIDFESGLNCWYAADIAFALRDLAGEGDLLDKREVQLFMDGYREVKSITDEEINNIPMFLRLHNLITYQRLVESLNIQKDESQPEWVNELIAKLETKMAHYEEGFRG